MTAVVCVYCGEDAQEKDHVVPRTRGGTNDLVNLTPSCRPCNRLKSWRLPSEWLLDVSDAVAEIERAAVAAVGVVLPRGSVKRNGRILIQLAVSSEFTEAIDAYSVKLKSALGTRVSRSASASALINIGLELANKEFQDGERRRARRRNTVVSADDPRKR